MPCHIFKAISPYRFPSENNPTVGSHKFRSQTRVQVELSHHTVCELGVTASVPTQVGGLTFQYKIHVHQTCHRMRTLTREHSS
jgi:hypothetical protein